MTSFEGYERCANEEICDVLTGSCVPDNERNKKGKTTLVVGGRKVVGDKDTMVRLREVLGGNFELPRRSEVAPASARAREARKGGITKEEVGRKIEALKKKPARSRRTERARSSPKREREPPREGVAVKASREEVRKTFMDCLDRVGARK